MAILDFVQGSTALLVSMPHVGTRLPEAIARRMAPVARRVPDTDWHVDRLYDFLEGCGASILRPTNSRYVIDLNRPPDGANLYPGQKTPSLCPTETFDGEPLYSSPAEVPSDGEVAERIDTYWRPYHEKIAEELRRLKARYGVALLWEAHSIRSRVPSLFEGRLPDLSLGTAGGASCAPSLATKLEAVADDAAGYTSVLNGRFVGGYITRNFGRPTDGMHAVQLELVQANYMEESYPFVFDEERADRIRPTLRCLIQTMLDWAAA